MRKILQNFIANVIVGYVRASKPLMFLEWNMPKSSFKFESFEVKVVERLGICDFPTALAVCGGNGNRFIIATKALVNMPDLYQQALREHEVCHLTKQLNDMLNVKQPGKYIEINDINFEYVADRYAYEQGYDMVAALCELHRSVPWWMLDTRHQLKLRIKKLKEEKWKR